MAEGKLKKYFLYAIGEILLVVIGILIALQINNANETRKNNDYVESLFDKVEQDLIANIRSANMTFNYYARLDSLARVVILNKPSKEEYLKNEALRALIVDNFPIQLIKDNITKLLEKEELVPPKYDNIFSTLKQLARVPPHLERDWDEIIAKAEKDKEFLTMNFGPYGTAPEILAERLDYYLTEDFRNKIHMVWDRNQTYMFKVAEFRSLCFAALIQSKRLRAQLRTEEVKNLFKKLNMEPFQEIHCEETALSPGNSVRERQLVYNSSSTSIQLEGSFSDGRRPFVVKIESHDFIILDHFPQPIFNDYTRVIKKVEQGNCVSQYVSRKNGYLILE